MVKYLAQNYLWAKSRKTLSPVENTGWALGRQGITEIASLAEGNMVRCGRNSHLATGFRSPLEVSIPQSVQGSDQGHCISHGKVALPAGAARPSSHKILTGLPGALQHKAERGLPLHRPDLCEDYE